MSKLVDLAQLTEKAPGYRTGTTAALYDGTLLAQAKAARRDLGTRMIPLDAETARKRIAPGKYLISRKLDGEFTVLVYRDGEAITLNPYGTVRAGAPFHTEAAALLAKAGVKSAIIGGELHVNRPDGKRARVHDVCRIARAPETAADVATLEFAAFAIYDVDGTDLTRAPATQVAKLRELFKGGKRTHAMETVEGDEKEVHARFRQWVVDEGGEGIVALSEAVGWFKIKPRHSLDLAVVGYSHGIEDRAHMLHSLLLAVVRNDGSFHLVGRTGGGFSDEQRTSMPADLAKREADSTYVEVNSDRVAYKMITPGPVAEISCLDIISETSSGEKIERNVIEWRADTRQWSGIRRLGLASIISPQFVRFRDDKQASQADTGLDQLTKIVEVPDVDASTADIRLPQATVLARAVATKDVKGKIMVRKLLMWRTNKEAVSPGHPAYVLLLTDYSPNRKMPLEREIRVSSSREQIEQIFETWKAENFVKGWIVK